MHITQCIRFCIWNWKYSWVIRMTTSYFEFYSVINLPTYSYIHIYNFFFTIYWIIVRFLGGSILIRFSNRFWIVHGLQCRNNSPLLFIATYSSEFYEFWFTYFFHEIHGFMGTSTYKPQDELELLSKIRFEHFKW